MNFCVRMRKVLLFLNTLAPRGTYEEELFVLNRHRDDVYGFDGVVGSSEAVKSSELEGAGWERAVS